MHIIFKKGPKIWEVWKPWKPEENAYDFYKTAHQILDEVQKNPFSSLDKMPGNDTAGIYDSNLSIIENLALINVQQQIARPTERVRHHSKDEVLAILTWPYQSGQRIDQLRPQMTEIYSGFYDTCNAARSKIINQIEEESKSRKTCDPNEIPPASLIGGLAGGIGAGYIDESVASGIVVGAGMSILIGLAELLRSRSRYTKKQTSNFNELTREERLNSLEALVHETLQVLSQNQ